MGYVVDLSEEWAPYTAARSAISNVIRSDDITRLNIDNDRLHTECIKEVEAFLVDGVQCAIYHCQCLSELSRHF